MIVSVSRRTDIPAFYFPWFLERLRAGEVFVRNPMNFRQVRRVPLDRGAVDGFVFWSKYPAELLKNLSALEGYPFYIQFTLNAYGTDVEGGLPELEKRIVLFQELSKKLSPGQVVWRYDPICFGQNYTPEWHIRQFEKLTGALAGYTDTCVISFLDMYRRMKKKTETMGIRPPEAEEQVWIGEKFGAVAVSCGLSLITCAEEINLEKYGIGKGACIDVKRLSALAGYPIPAKKDRNQRSACGCAASVDIGVYDTCRYQCAYCYASGGRRSLAGEYTLESPMLCGYLEAEGSPGKVGAQAEERI